MSSNSNTTRVHRDGVLVFAELDVISGNTLSLCSFVLRHHDEWLCILITANFEALCEVKTESKSWLIELLAMP